MGDFGNLWVRNSAWLFSATEVQKAQERLETFLPHGGDIRAC
jgi:hypothetical protein